MAGLRATDEGRIARENVHSERWKSPTVDASFAVFSRPAGRSRAVFTALLIDK